jgi:hypothetical protein
MTQNVDTVGELSFVGATLAVALTTGRGKPCPYEFANRISSSDKPQLNGNFARGGFVIAPIGG